jgi:hypothetical protein
VEQIAGGLHPRTETERSTKNLLAVDLRLRGENDFVTIDAVNGVIPHQFACS